MTKKINQIIQMLSSHKIWWTIIILHLTFVITLLIRNIRLDTLPSLMSTHYDIIAKIINISFMILYASQIIIYIYLYIRIHKQLQNQVFKKGWKWIPLKNLLISILLFLFSLITIMWVK